MMEIEFESNDDEGQEEEEGYDEEEEGYDEEEEGYDEEEEGYDGHEEEEDQIPSIFPIGYTIDLSSELAVSDPRTSRVGSINSSSGVARGGLGSQALPVCDRLRSDWDGIPIDGSEYLFIVRQEANSRPKVVRKENPYELKISTRRSKSSSSFDSIDHSTYPISRSKILNQDLSLHPPEVWRNRFIDRFLNIRQSIQHQEPWHWDLAEEYRRPPPANDESNWKVFISGRKSNLQEFPPRSPSPLFLKALEQTTVLAVLSHYRTWIQQRVDAYLNQARQRMEAAEGVREQEPNDSQPPCGSSATTTKEEEIVLLSNSDGSWLIGLLSVLDGSLTSEDIYQLRQLARTCQEVVRITHLVLQLDRLDRSAQSEAAVAWMVIAAITDVWGQKDLWLDVD